MKNIDRIRTMGINELAKFLSIVANFGNDLTIEQIDIVSTSANEIFDCDYLTAYENWLEEEIKEIE